MGVVIGKRCKKATRENAMDYVLGYTCVNDVSARDMQWSDGQWTRGKGLDTFCPMGPIITDEIDAFNSRVITRVNGEVLQDGNSNDLIFDIPALIEYISEWITLEAGDVIATRHSRWSSTRKGRRRYRDRDPRHRHSSQHHDLSFNSSSRW